MTFQKLRVRKGGAKTGITSRYLLVSSICIFVSFYIQFNVFLLATYNDYIVEVSHSNLKMR